MHPTAAKARRRVTLESLGVTLRPLLNGWRRFGIVIATLWLLGVLGFALSEYSSDSNGYFVYQTIPLGTIIEGNKVTLPDGKVVTITEEQQFELRYKLEQDLERLKKDQPLRPWEIDWSKLAAIPKVTEFRWLRLFILALVTPMLLWFLAETAVLVVAWIKRGFKGQGA